MRERVREREREYDLLLIGDLLLAEPGDIERSRERERERERPRLGLRLRPRESERGIVVSFTFVSRKVDRQLRSVVLKNSGRFGALFGKLPALSTWTSQNRV